MLSPRVQHVGVGGRKLASPGPIFEVSLLSPARLGVIDLGASDAAGNQIL